MDRNIPFWGAQNPKDSKFGPEAKKHPTKPPNGHLPENQRYHSFKYHFHSSSNDANFPFIISLYNITLRQISIWLQLVELRTILTAGIWLKKKISSIKFLKLLILRFPNHFTLICSHFFYRCLKREKKSRPECISAMFFQRKC